MSLTKVYCNFLECPWNTGHGRCDADEIELDDVGVCMTERDSDSICV